MAKICLYHNGKYVPGYAVDTSCRKVIGMKGFPLVPDRSGFVSVRPAFGKTQVRIKESQAVSESIRTVLTYSKKKSNV